MIADHFEALFFVLDGVIWWEGQLLPQAEETLAYLRQKGKKVRFVTNDPRLGRDDLCAKLRTFSILVEPEEVVTASWATAWYLKERGIRSSYVLGSDSLRRELEAMHIVTTDSSPQSVVVGYHESAAIGDIAEAIRLIQKGALFVATNPDVYFSLPEGRVPATGSIVKMIEGVTGQEALVVGKPSPYIFHLLLRDLGNVERGRVALVGGNLETDIRGAHGVGMVGILLALQDVILPLPSSPSYPDFVIASLARLIGKLPEVPHREAVCAILRNTKEEVLLVRRADNHLWCLPTGKIEEGESPEETVHRELKEELGIKVPNLKLRAVYTQDPALHWFSPQGELIHFIVFVFCGEYDGEDIVLDPREGEVWGFFSLDRLPSPFLSLHKRWIIDLS